MASVPSGKREDDFQGVTTSTNFPDASSTLVEPFKEPDERVDECDPQQKFNPDVGDKFRERVCWSDDDEVVRGREWAEINF